MTEYQCTRVGSCGFITLKTDNMALYRKVQSLCREAVEKNRQEEMQLEVVPCKKCGALPIRESVDNQMLQMFFGRYRCPACGNAPRWGQAYPVNEERDWVRNAEVWNTCQQSGCPGCKEENG